VVEKTHLARLHYRCLSSLHVIFVCYLSWHAFLSLHLQTGTANPAVYCDSEPSSRVPSTIQSNYKPTFLITPTFCSISNAFHVLLRRSHDYFQGIFPSKLSELPEGLNMMVCKSWAGILAGAWAYCW